MKYDKKSIPSILEYSYKLKGKTFNDVLMQSDLTKEKIQTYIDKYGNKKNKGGLGNLLQTVYYDYPDNSDPNPDFLEVNMELKVTPYEITKNNKHKMGERLVLTMIKYDEQVEHDFYKSHLWHKIEKTLLIIYLRDKSIPNKLDSRIDFIKLFTPSKRDLKIITDDYNKIITKIENGEAHLLSESDTMYLSACTKGSTASKSLQPQKQYNPDILAKRRAFSFKPSYMTAILEEMISKSENFSILSNYKNIDNKSFEEITLDILNQYIGKTDKELCKLLDRDYNNNKSQWTDLAFRMLGVKSNNADEFKKANIVVKTIRLENEKLKEHMSFPNFKFKELVQEDWESSTLRTYFEETKFLFVVYDKNENNDIILSKCLYWNMPVFTLDNDVMNEWLEIRDKINIGVNFDVTDKVTNDIPKPNKKGVIHIRPHASQSAYLLKTGYSKGNIHKDGDSLPDNQIITKHCFWLNNNFIINKIIKEKSK